MRLALLPLDDSICLTSAIVTLTLPRFPFLSRALLLAAGLATLALAVLYGFARCPVAQWLHVPCPGCGMTRSVEALAHFDLAGVLRYNPLGPVHVALSAWIIGRSMYVLARDGNLGALAYKNEATRMTYAFFALQAIQLALWGLRWFGLFGGPCPI